MAILSVVAFYTLDMYQGISSQKRQVDDHSKMEEIAIALKAYFGGHEGLPAAEIMGGRTDVIPSDSLSLAQNYRFDSHGYPYSYISAGTASGFQVDGRLAAGVIISFGEDQQQDYVVAGTTYTTGGDDILVPVEVNTEAVSIALTELESLGKRVRAYNRQYAGRQNDPPGTSYYGDVAAGAPPIIDPDDYDGEYLTYPQLYLYNPYYPTSPDAGPPPTDEDLAYDEPDHNWPDGPIYNNWPARPPDPPVGADLPPNFAGWSAPGPGFAVWPFGTDVFGDYNPTPSVPVAPITAGSDPIWIQSRIDTSYELIDEGGCALVGGIAPADANCNYVHLDTSIDPIGNILTQYGLGASFGSDPWGNAYQWGTSLIYNSTDSRYHLFFSVGPDGIAGTNDDVLLF